MQEQKYKISFVDKILDNVHGFIQLTEVERDIIDLPIFKRLQGIKQLSLINCIFPGSEHTRYAHSLGVMHICDKMALSLKYSDEERQLIRISGLLHDIGHYPLSHVGESAYRAEADIISADDIVLSTNTSNKNRIDDLAKRDFAFKGDFMLPNSNHFHHERIGEQIIKSDRKICEIILRECSFISIDDVCDIIIGNTQRNPEIADKVQILHSEIDADGIDYMLRDALFSGTSFGSFELDQLISCLQITNQCGAKIVGISPKGISAADQFIINKFFSYMQITFNKHAAIIEHMAEKIIFILRSNALSFPSQEAFSHAWISQHADDIQFLRFTDDFFWKSLFGVEEYSKLITPIVKSYICKLVLKNELEWIPDGEYKKLIKVEYNDIKNKNIAALVKEIQNTSIYKQTSRIRNQGKSISLLHIRKMSNHVPVTIYNKRIALKRDEEGRFFSEEYLNQQRVRRLQEGMAVIDNDGTRLLCDDSRSLMQHIYNIAGLIYRQYSIMN